MEEKLICAVANHSELNDASCYFYRDRNKMDLAWRHISEEIGQPDQKNITAESGQDVSLPCRAPNNNIIVLEWRRAEHGANYVFLYRDGRFDPANQHPSFKNRVDLQDRQMKDGDVSLILNNVNTADTGIYKCRVFMRETRLWQLIYLTVVDPPGHKGGQEKDEDNRDGGKEDRGKEDGSVGLIVGLTVPAVLLVAVVVGILIYKKTELCDSVL